MSRPLAGCTPGEKLVFRGKFNVSAIVCLTPWLKTFFEKTLWGGSLWDVKLVRHVSDRLNLFDVSKCGEIGGEHVFAKQSMFPLNSTSPKVVHRHVRVAPPQLHGGPLQAVLRACVLKLPT